MKTLALAGALTLAACSATDGKVLTTADLTAWNEATVADVEVAMTSRRLDATRLVRIYQRRIALLDPELKALLSLNPDALTDAAARDRDFERTGKLTGPLHGIPIVLKDNLDVGGLATTAGCEALADGFAVDDAFVVARLRAAGAIILGKANLSELAAFSSRSRSSLGGDTVNAFGNDRAPLGSSGGSATAVSANLGMVGLGTDTNSSVLYPAAVAGLVGLRPTQGLVSRDGVVAGLDETTTIGPMTRTVADAAILLDVVAGSDPADTTTSGAAAHIPASGYAASLGTMTVAQLRIGTSDDLLHSSTFPFVGAMLDPDVEQQTADVLTQLSAHGATVTNVGSVFAVLAPALPAYSTVLSGEALNVHYELNQYLAHQRNDAPIRSVEAIVASGKFLPDLDSLLHQMVSSPETPGSDNPATQKLIDARHTLRDAMVALMDAHQVDVLMYPSTVRAAQPLDTTDMANYGVSAGLSTQTGMPAVTVMLGYDRDGMPLGVTFLGRPWDETRLLAVAAAYEAMNPVRHAPLQILP